MVCITVLWSAGQPTDLPAMFPFADNKEILLDLSRHIRLIQAFMYPVSLLFFGSPGFKLYILLALQVFMLAPSLLHIKSSLVNRTLYYLGGECEIAAWCLADRSWKQPAVLAAASLPIVLRAVSFIWVIFSRGKREAKPGNEPTLVFVLGLLGGSARMACRFSMACTLISGGTPVADGATTLLLTFICFCYVWLRAFVKFDITDDAHSLAVFLVEKISAEKLVALLAACTAYNFSAIHLPALPIPKWPDQASD